VIVGPVEFARPVSVTQAKRQIHRVTAAGQPPPEVLQLKRPVRGKRSVSGPAQAAVRVVSAGCQFEGSSSAMRRAG
jgi:hypothetical protein